MNQNYLTDAEIRKLIQLVHTEMSARRYDDPIRNASVITDLEAIINKLDFLRSRAKYTHPMLG